MIKQKIVVKGQLLKSQSKNQRKIRKLLECCLNLYDYKILLHLITNGFFEKDSEFDLEAFSHRLGKIANIELIEEKLEDKQQENKNT